ALERELSLDPILFVELARQRREISHVEIAPKLDCFHNELSKFRYDVTLHLGESRAPTEYPWRHLDGQSPPLESLRRILTNERPERLGIRSVPNARTAADAAVRTLMASHPDMTVAEFRRAQREQRGVEPGDVVKLGSELGYTTDLSWINSDSSGHFDVV